MEWLARLLLAAGSCAAIVRCEGSAGQFCEGLNSCSNIFTLEIYKGDTQSLHLPLNADQQKLVKKCDPETKTWEDEILAAPGESKPLANKTISISLIDEIFTVHNAGKTEEGLYKIEQYLNNHCLAKVTITVIDPPLSTAVTPSNVTETAEAFPPGTDYPPLSTAVMPSNITETAEVFPPGTDYPPLSTAVIPSNVTETAEAFPPGTDYGTIALIATLIIFGSVSIFLVGVCVQKWIKSKHRPKKDTCEVDPEKLMNGSGPHQQQETTTV